MARRRFAERWILMYSADGGLGDMNRFHKLLPPKGRFWADPCLVRRNDEFYVFFEDASVASGHGHVSVMRMAPDGAHSMPSIVIEKPYHLSYPYLFEWKNDIFMIPESAENGTIELYRCRRFPDQWEFVKNIMENVTAYDATLVENDGLWWMFSNMKEHAGTSGWDELYVFYSHDPVDGAWQAHPMNPVISDVRRARPAGRLFRDGDVLYRPSQNSAHRYGYGLNINKLVELTATTYREELVQSVEPVWDKSIKAVHTLARAPGLVLIDAMHRAPKNEVRADDVQL